MVAVSFRPGRMSGNVSHDYTRLPIPMHPHPLGCRKHRAKTTPIGPRLAQGSIRLGVFVQMAERGDDVADASVPWPDSRAEVPFGTLTLTARVDDQEPERRKIIFDPVFQVVLELTCWPGRWRHGVRPVE
jgi:hypothetical protein